MHSQNISTTKQISSRVSGRTGTSYYKEILVGCLLLAAFFLLFPAGYKLLALLILPAIWMVRWVLVGSLVPRTPLDWPILLILVMVLVSVWATFDLSLSIGKIASLLLGIVFYYAIVDLADTKKSLDKVIILFFLSGMVLAVVSLLGTQWSPKTPLVRSFLDDVPQVFQGLPGAESGFNPNQAAGVLILYIPLQVVLLGYWIKRTVLWSGRGLYADSSPRRGRVLVVVFGLLSFLITAGVLFLTQSRGAMVGLAAGLVTVAAVGVRWGKVLAIGCLIAVLVAISAGLADGLVASGVETEAVGTIGLAGRLEIWSRALQAVADFPLGMGMNTFRQIVHVLYPLFTISSDFDLGHAHNHLLQAALDLGIPGLVAYLALWLGAGFLLVQTATGSRSPFYRSVALGLIGGFIAYFTYGITDAVALGAKPGFAFWWALGLVVATHRLSYLDTRIE